MVSSILYHLILGGLTVKSLKLAILMCTAVVLITACGQSADNNGKVTLKQASSEVASIYKSSCIGCHATDLSGKMGDPTNLQLVFERLSYDEIVAKISEGGETMPSFKEKLTEEEINSLAAWLSKQQ